MNGEEPLEPADSNFISCCQTDPDVLHPEDEEQPDAIDRASERRLIGSCQRSEARLPPPPERPSREIRYTDSPSSASAAANSA